MKSCNSYTKCTVRAWGETFDSFKVGKGIRQCDTSSPVLYNFALESVVRRMPRQQRIEVN